jgi:hypothetical protein
VRDVALATTMLLTVTPPPTATDVPLTMKLDPVSVAETVVPCTPVFGVTLASVGPVPVTVNVCGPVVPNPVVTVTFRAPIAALGATVSVV